MNNTAIEWTDFSVNPIRARHKQTGAVGHHCEKVSDGCKFCYSSRLQRRFSLPEFAGPSRREEVEHFLDEKVLQQVLRRKKPSKIFWCDMTDIFGEWVSEEWIDRCFAVMALTPQHVHQVLTKRPERMQKFSGRATRFDNLTDEINRMHLGKTGEYPSPIRPCDGDWPLSNVWLGVSVENQAAADERIPLLLQVPAAVRFLSCEPLLGPVDLTNLSAARDESPDHVNALTGIRTTSHPPEAGSRIDWVIVGGESGSNARPCHLEWVRSLVRQCQAAGVACFVKQLGLRASDEVNGIAGAGLAVPNEAAPLISLRLRDKKGGDWEEWPADLRVREFPEVSR